MANAAQVLLDPLPVLVAAMRRKRSEVTLIAHADGTPSGVMLLPSAALRLIPTHGFVDLKEQAMPLISARFDVRVARRGRPTGLPVRSVEEYLQVLRQYHRRRMRGNSAADPLAEDWRSAFGLAEPGANIDPSARLHDSVVLAGGRIEAGAVLVRSIVCGNGVVGRGRSVVDEVVSGAKRARRAA